MASFKSSQCSSSSVPTGGWTYDVFLSFRGEDTRNNFVDHLYAALVQRGLCVFKDDEMLRSGEPISPELLKAIEESRFAVVVFSENYANSSWCLDELAKIMECQDRMGLRVLPVFYHVDPSDVRGQKRDFATAFQQHKKKFRGEKDKVKKWRKALAAAANISGSHISAVSGGESVFINKIVQEILGNIQPRGMENNLIDIMSRINELNSKLGIEATQEVRMVGIYGMGGIGKTTIAKALFRRISYKFEGSSFVKDVRENSKRDMCALQEKILKDILVLHHESKIKDPEDGAEMIQTRFCNKKVLLVLDDVDDFKQLEFLAAKCEWFGAGSRIIITTRDERLLSDANAKYKPAFLLKEQAVELFSRHAFRKNSPPKGYEELSNRAVCYTGCLPLALKVLGSFFRGREAGVWESALDRLSKTPNDEIFNTLKLSFDGLQEYEKKIFLDIACFFKGREVEHVTRVLDSFGFYPKIGITALIEKSLITVSNKRLDMHDLVQEMGWQIVRESFPNSRLWQHEEIHDFIKKNRNLEAIEAMVGLDKEYGHEDDPVFWHNVNPDFSFSADVFENMTNLRLLDINQKFTSCKPTILPDELRWLCWNDYPFSSLPEAHMHKLVGLEMQSRDIEHLWKGAKIMPNLKFIRLQKLYRLTSFPDVSGAPNVERLILLDCWGLVEFHESLGSLRRLVYLHIERCENLKRLPSMIEMESLETLILSQCKCLERIPEVSPCMVKLSHIYLDDCWKIEELPSSIRYLSNLSFLNLKGCKSLQNIPNSICELKDLKNLNLHNCQRLQQLPEEFGSMEKLEELQLGVMGSCSAFHVSINFHALTNLCSLRKLDLSWRQIEGEDFPKNLHAFSFLEELNLSGNSKLIQLPASISHLSCLKRLALIECGKLQNLHALPSGIQVLKATNCSSLKKIEDLSKGYERLYKIWLSGCMKLLKDQGNERYLDKMLKQSFLMKFAAVDHCLSITIPGSKIPSWFKEQQQGNRIALKLPPKWHTQILGFTICGLFWQLERYASISIQFEFENDGMFSNGARKGLADIPALEVVDWNPEEVDWNGNVSIGYTPLSLFQHDGDGDSDGDGDDDFQHEDSSHMVGNLPFDAGRSVNVVRCGAHLVYKEDVESIQETKTCIPDCGDHVCRTGNIFRFENDGMFIDGTRKWLTGIPASEVHWNRNVSIAYIPFSLFQHMHDDDFQHEDWSLIEGNLVIDMFGGESIQQTKTCISDCWDRVDRFGNIFTYEDNS